MKRMPEEFGTVGHEIPALRCSSIGIPHGQEDGGHRPARQGAKDPKGLVGQMLTVGKKVKGKDLHVHAPLPCSKYG